VVSKDPDDPLALLRELAEALPERYRRVLILFYYEERSVSEVAVLLGIPEGTVKTNLYRARALMLEQLERHGLNDPTFWLETGT
jgi:RNA polymerase sigma factor (sigma-70 family)